MDNDEIKQRIARAKEFVDALKVKLDKAETPEEREQVLKDYMFYQGKLAAYKEVLRD